MLIPIVFDAEAIDTEEDENAKLEREDILKQILEFGILHFRDGQSKKLLERLKTIPTIESKRWIEAITTFALFNIEAKSLKPIEMSPIFRNDSALIVVPTKKADASLTTFGLKAPRSTVAKTKTEYVAASHVNKSVSIRERSEWSNKDLWPEENLKKIGDERIGPLFRVSRRVSLVDRYAFSTFCSDGEKSGLSWLLKQLNSSSQRSCKISIFSTHSPDRKTTKPPADIDIWIDLLQKQLENVNGELNIYLGPDHLYKKNAHDRYLRVDDRRIIDLGKGVDSFSGGKIKQRSSFNYSVLRQSQEVNRYRDLEGKLSKNDSIHNFRRILGEGFIE